MKALSIKNTLIGLFAFVALFGVAQGIFATVQSMNVQTRVSKIDDIWNPAVAALANINAEISDYATAESNYLHATGAQDRTDFAAAMDNKAAQISQNIARYEQLTENNRIEKSWERFQNLWGDYLKLHEQMMQLAQAGHKDQAVALLHSQMQDVFVGLDDALDENATSNKLRATNEVDAVDAATATMSQVFASICALLALTAIAAMIVVIRSVTMPLSRLTWVMSEVTRGNLAIKVPYVNHHNELGAMAGAVLEAQQNALRVKELNQKESMRSGQTRERGNAMSSLVESLAQVVERAIKGDFSARVMAQFKDEDLKSLSAGINDLVETMERGLDETGKVLSALARTDLTKKVNGDYEGAFAQLKDDTNAVVDNLARIIRQLRATSSGFKDATSEILTGATHLAQRTTKQAAAIEQTSMAMEQLSGTVTENAGRAKKTCALAQGVFKAAEEAGTIMGQSTEAMERISASSSKISNIIGMIDDIAFQTNLLALNASVEAARAGEAGKGFAVVAIEVRRLAQSAADASAEVKALIEQSAREFAGGEKLVRAASEHINRTLAGVRDSTGLIEEISMASEAQANSIAEISAAMHQMDEMTQHNTALVEETNNAIAQTQSEAVRLDKVVEVFVLDPLGIAKTARHTRPKPSLARPPAPKKTSCPQSGNLALDADWDEF